MGTPHPYLDHDEWWRAKAAANEDLDALAEQWRQMNSTVTLCDGSVRAVNCEAGAAIHLLQAVCIEVGARYRIETFDWPTPGAHVCIRTQARHFPRVTSADSLGDIRMVEDAARAALAAYRSSLFGAQSARPARAARP